MVFLPAGSRHDSWRRFCSLHADLLAGSGLPDAVALNEDRFRSLLRDGAATGAGAAVSLVDLSAEQWAALERFAAVFFDACESCAPLDSFPTFRRERERRLRQHRAEQAKGTERADLMRHVDADARSCQFHRSGCSELVAQLRGVEYQFGVITPNSPIHRVDFDIGLSDAEIASVESRFGFRFPPDLRDFLNTALPRGPQFPDWRTGPDSKLREWLDRPRDGVLFDIEYNGFWLEEWGPRPDAIEEARQVAKELISDAPRLIPIFGHRMMADEPCERGNPVFSVHQTDIICYGFDLADYLRHEFDLPGRQPWRDKVRRIRFWDFDRFQEVRWAQGSCRFDNRSGILP